MQYLIILSNLPRIITRNNMSLIDESDEKNISDINFTNTTIVFAFLRTSKFH